ncbi:glycosyltransferase [Caenimonas koreensis]|uniref:glycosyltransferase n=1 Tax=Caenimonas koreensis TaxID=367474 RepID=UPI00188E7B8C|nr:glycosyltransferase [Caenimonas koreensis]
MKVLHVIPSLSSTDGGPSRAIALMERALSAQGVTVETAATDDDGPGRHNGKPCATPLPENGVVRRYFSKRRDFYKAAPSFGEWIGQHVRDYDLVHIHALFSYMPMAAARAARRAGVPYIVRPLGTLNSYGMANRRPLLKSLSMRWIEGPALRHAAAVHFTSEDEAVQARMTGVAMREQVIPLGVEIEPFGAAGMRLPRPEAPRILFLSRLDPKKNIEGLLDAFALLLKDLPQATLVVAGTGEPAYVEALQRRAQQLHVAASVQWPGHVQGDAKVAAFANADVFALPSFSENFGIAAAEALAQGLPCLLGEGVALAGDVAQAAAGVAVKPDAAAIALGLQRIIGGGMYASMARNAASLARDRYSAEAMGIRLKTLYTDILRLT